MPTVAEIQTATKSPIQGGPVESLQPVSGPDTLLLETEHSQKARARPSRRAGLYLPRRLPSRYRRLAVHSVQFQGL